MFTHTKTPMTAIYQRQKHQIDMLVRAAKEVISVDAEVGTRDPRWDRAIGALAASVGAVEDEEEG